MHGGAPDRFTNRQEPAAGGSAATCAGGTQGLFPALVYPGLSSHVNSKLHRSIATSGALQFVGAGFAFLLPSHD